MIGAAFKDDEFRSGWPAVLAGFAIAIFVRGFTSYGYAVFLSQFQSLHGWSAGAIGGATTLSLLVGAALLPWVGRAILRFGTRGVLSGGVIVLGIGAAGFSAATEPWQLYPFGFVMGAGAAFASVTAISIMLAARFERQRGLALSSCLERRQRRRLYRGARAPATRAA